MPSQNSFRLVFFPKILRLLAPVLTVQIGTKHRKNGNTGFLEEESRGETTLGSISVGQNLVPEEEDGWVRNLQSIYVLLDCWKLVPGLTMDNLVEFLLFSID